MAGRHMCVSIHSSHEQVAEAIALLRASGADLNLVSVMARDDWSVVQETGAFRLDEHTVYGGAHGAFWESMWTTLPGKSGHWIFEEGALLAAGHIAVKLYAEARSISSLRGEEILPALLARLGLPARDIRRYAQELSGRRLLLFIEGDLASVDSAQRTLERAKPTNNTLHHEVTD